ncbi:MAG: mandelate racemase/muconate lactonizing enzyme family protein [Pusillimonas sp.]
METFLIDRWCLLRINCEDGTQGIGEAGAHAWPAQTAGVIEHMSRYLIGKHADAIEHHSQFLQRSMHFSGALLAGAISAIDIALWDIKGRHLGVPIYDLMGGKTRDKVRCYIHVHGDSTDELVADAVAKRRAGFTALRFSPFKPDFYLRQSFEGWVRDAVERVAAVHEAVGHDADLCIELHRQMTPAESIALAQRLRQFHPYFYEDPMRPDSPEGMADIQRRSELPIATGERYTSIYQFEALLKHGGCDYIRPDLCLCLGLSGSKKAAALAEAHHVNVIPHNPLSPVSTAACVQLDACIPNFALQEYTDESRPPQSKLLKQALKLESGYLIVPDRPGLGIELDEAMLCSLPPSNAEPFCPIGYDGSVQDW